MSGLQPLISEMLLGDWTNVTTLIERDNGNGIRVSRKPLTWAERVAPMNASWSFKNANNNLYGRNPNSAYYGLLGRNTQVRHRLRMLVDTFTRTLSNSWGSTEDATPVAWTLSGGTNPADYDVTGTFGTHTLGSVNVMRTSTAIAAGAYDLTMVCKASALATGADLTAWLATGTDISNFYTARLVLLTDSSVRLDLRKWVAGVETNLHPTGATGETVGTYAADTQWAVRLRYLYGGFLSAKAWLATDAEPDGWDIQTIVRDTDIADFTKVGLFSRAETGNTNVSPIISFGSVEVNSYRFWGEIPSFTPQRDSTGQFKTVPVTAAGISQRLGAGTGSLRSALTRAMDGVSEGDFVPVAHWPMEETAGATVLGNLRDGGTAAVSGSVSLASYTGALGSDPVPVLNTGGQISGVFPPMTIESGASGVAIWQDQFVGVVSSTLAATATFMDINVQNVGGDNVIKWRIDWDNTFKILSARPFTSLGTTLTGAALDFGSNPTFYDRPLLFSLSVFQSTVGGFVSHQFTGRTPDLPGLLFGGNTVGAGLTTTVPTPQSWHAYGVAANAGWTFSHHALYIDPAIADFPNITNNAAALNGLIGELSGVRMNRLAREQAIPFELIGDESDTAPCGPQRADKLINIFTDAANADQGILQDARDRLALQYITRTALENTPLFAEFSHSGTNDLEAFQVVDDDRTVRNKITARRTSGGSFATAEITEGRTATAEPPDGLGTYPEDLSWNLATDDQLFAFAGWRAHLAGWDEARYPGTAIWRDREAINSVPALSAAVLAMDIATHYVITDLPEDLPPDDVGLLVQGYDELIANFEHRITFDGQPSGPYVVIELDDDDARVDDDHFLRTAVDSTATSWEIANDNAGMQLISDDTQDGWTWVIDGERVTVTDVAAPTIAFVGVGTASTGSSGSRTPGLPASMANGNLATIFASTRNSGTGIPDTPTDWHRFSVFDAASNVQVFGRIKDASWSTMPTITYTGGAANEDTIAQSMAVSGNFNDITKLQVAFCGSLNPSAQNISISGIPIVNLPENLFAFYYGWKQDDFTSATQPSSWTEAQEASTTAGNDASQVWGYRAFTSRPTVGQLTPALAIVGGASAISRGGILVIASDYQLVTVTRSTNGISKAHAVGAVPMLLPAAYIAL
jgi:hypothetical protein